MKRLGQQSVARQDGDAFAGDDVQRRAASSHGVVVHRGQVVVDERVGMNQFDGARRWQSQAAIATDSLCARQAENGTQPLASSEQAVAHGGIDELREPQAMKAGTRQAQFRLQPGGRRDTRRPSAVFTPCP